MTPQVRRPCGVSRPSLAASLLAALAAWAGPAAAHEYWLQPSRYTAAPGDTVRVQAFAGTGFRGEAKPYAAPRVVHFRLRGPKTFELSDTALNGDLVWARFVVADGGGVLLAYESDFAKIELPAPEFDKYLGTEGLDGPRATRAAKGAATGPGRERYARCSKTWIAGGTPARATEPVGMTLELQPLADPTTPGALKLRVLYHGQPLAGTLVRAWRQDLVPGARGDVPHEAAARDSVGPAAEARSDAAGVATLAIRGAGEWLVSGVHMVPSDDPAAADWQSYWASLTFVRGPRRR
jgi:uncharacterized GH25 family protein